MIVLGSYSTGWCQNKDVISSTGEQDTICIPIETVKTINAKLTELQYEKQINSNYKLIVENDSCIISNLTDSINNVNVECTNKLKRIRIQRNVVGGIGIIGIILAIIF